MKLAQAILALRSEEEVKNFFADLCTPGELKDFEERWTIAQLLAAGRSSYRRIAETTGASVTTVTRVARFLKDEPYQGYRLILERLHRHHGSHQSQ